MSEEDWKVLEAMVDATLLSVGVLAELLIRKQALDREEVISTLRQLEAWRAAKDPDDDAVQMGAAVVDRLAMNLEEGMTFLPRWRQTGSSSEGQP